MKRLQAILASEGLVASAAMPESEFWSIIDRYREVFSRPQQQAITKTLMQEFAVENGPDWRAWKEQAKAFEQRLYQLGMALQDRLYAWQDSYKAQLEGEGKTVWEPRLDGEWKDEAGNVIYDWRITPSDSSMRSLGYSIFLFGKSVYQRVASNPGILPKQNSYNFKWSGGDPVFKSFVKAKHSLSEFSDLMHPWNGDGRKPPRGWK